MEALTPCLFLLPTLVACAVARYVGRNVASLVLIAALTPSIVEATERPLGSFVEGTYNAYGPQGEDLGVQPFSGYVGHAEYDGLNFNVIVTEDDRYIFQEWGTEDYSDQTEYLGDYNLTGIEEAQAAWATHGGDGFSLETVGDSLATMTGDIGTTLGGAVLLVVGVYGSFVVVRHGLRWLRGATAALLLVAMLSPALLQAQSPPTTEELLADVVTELQTANGKLADLRAESDDVKFLLSVAAVGVGAVWGSQLWACVVTGKNQRNVW